MRNLVHIWREMNEAGASAAMAVEEMAWASVALVVLCAVIVACRIVVLVTE